MKKIVVLLMLVPALHAFSQRVEIPYDPSFSQPMVIPAGENGLLVVQELYGQRQGKESVYEVVIRDTTLTEKKKLRFTCDAKLQLNKSLYKQGRVFFLFSSTQKENFKIVQVLLQNGSIESMDFSFAKGFEVSHFEVSWPGIFIGGTLKKEPALLRINLFDDKLSVLPMAYGIKNASISNLSASLYDGAYATTLLKINKNVLASIRYFTGEEKKFTELKLEDSKGYDFLNAQISEINKNERIILGAYGKGKKGSQGFYFVKYYGDKQEFMEFYQFSMLKNFYAFLDPLEREKAEKRAKKNVAKGKDTQSQYRILAHDVKEVAGNYLVVGEAYYPVYRTERVRDYYGGRPYYRNETVFDGYFYTHGIVACFSETGKLLWDQSFKIEETKMMKLSERINVNTKTDGVELSFAYQGRVDKISINLDGEMKKESGKKLRSKFEGDEVKLNDLGDLEYWYGQYYLAWGNQKIKNKQGESVKKKRKVFYINKVE